MNTSCYYLGNILMSQKLNLNYVYGLFYIWKLNYTSKKNHSNYYKQFFNRPLKIWTTVRNSSILGLSDKKMPVIFRLLFFSNCSLNFNLIFFQRSILTNKNVNIVFITKAAVIINLNASAHCFHVFLSPSWK